MLVCPRPRALGRVLGLSMPATAWLGYLGHMASCLSASFSLLKHGNHLFMVRSDSAVDRAGHAQQASAPKHTFFFFLNRSAGQLGS